MEYEPKGGSGTGGKRACVLRHHFKPDSFGFLSADTAGVLLSCLSMTGTHLSPVTKTGSEVRGGGNVRGRESLRCWSRGALDEHRWQRSAMLLKPLYRTYRCKHIDEKEVTEESISIFRHSSECWDIWKAERRVSFFPSVFAIALTIVFKYANIECTGRTQTT